MARPINRRTGSTPDANMPPWETRHHLITRDGEDRIEVLPPTSTGANAWSGSGKYRSVAR